MWAAKSGKDRLNVDRVQTLMCSDPSLGVRLIVEEGYENLFGIKDPNSGLTSGFSTMTMPQRMMHEEFMSSWLRNLLQQWTIHLIHLT
jgi:hypothetical protein